jgi:hypothetical protein
LAAKKHLVSEGFFGNKSIIPTFGVWVLEFGNEGNVLAFGGNNLSMVGKVKSLRILNKMSQASERITGQVIPLQ